MRLAPFLQVARVPLGIAITQAIRLVRPLAGTALDLYAAVQPPGDKNLLSRPEFKAMFLDDLLNGSRFQTSAPLNDLLLFTRDWGFTAADVTVPVRWWHGDEDHIVPFRHGQHLVARLPDATLTIDRRREPPRRARHRRGGHLHADGARPAARAEAAQDPAGHLIPRFRCIPRRIPAVAYLRSAE